MPNLCLLLVNHILVINIFSTELRVSRSLLFHHLLIHVVVSIVFRDATLPTLVSEFLLLRLKKPFPLFCRSKNIYLCLKVLITSSFLGSCNWQKAPYYNLQRGCDPYRIPSPQVSYFPKQTSSIPEYRYTLSIAFHTSY